MRSLARAGARAAARLIGRPKAKSGARVRGVFEVVHRNADGAVLSRETVQNLIVNEGLNEYINSALLGVAATSSWFLGLKATGTPQAGDTMASHSTWAEISTEYDEATRPAWTPGALSGQSVDNSASPGVFSMNATITAFGAFMTSNNGKGGATGKLFSVVDFASSKAVNSGDTLQVTYTQSMSDDAV